MLIHSSANITQTNVLYSYIFACRILIGFIVI